MPLMYTAGNCGPKTLCRILQWDIDKYLNDAKAVMGHIEGKGVEPSGFVKALQKNGYKARWSQNNTLEACDDFLEEWQTKKGIVVLDYYDELFGSTDGHYVQYLGRAKYGNLKVWNPDIPEKDEFILPLDWFKIKWHDYSIDTFDFLYRVAIFAHK